MNLTVGADHDPNSTPGQTFVPGQWDLWVVFVVVGVGWFMSMAAMQFLLASVEDAANWQKVALQMPGFLVWWALGVRFVQMIDTRGTLALGLGPRGVPRFLSGVAWYLPLGLLWWASLQAYIQILGFFEVAIPRQAVAEAFFEPGLSAWAYGVLFFSALVAAPLGEEVVFRGLLHGWLRRYLGLPLTAAIVGVLFGAMHVEWGGDAATIVFLFPLAILGFMLSWVRERPGGLWACVALHATHNAVQLGLAFLLR